MKKRWLGTALALLLAVLLLSGLILMAGASSTVYLIAVNDVVLQVTPENMPVMQEGQLYIPYTMLSNVVTGTDLGVRAQYSSVRGTLTVLSGEHSVVFDLKRNTAGDENGAAVAAAALVRNSMIYLPIDWLCRYFDSLVYSLTYTPYGVLVRLSSPAAVLTDAEFVDAADSLLRQKYIAYRNALAASSGPTPTATATVSPSPTPSPSVTPSPSPTPTPTQTPEPVPTAQVCLALRWGRRADEVTELLEENGQRALFLFTCQELMVQDDLVRRLTARGHQVGLLLTGENEEDCLRQLEQGRQLLSDICRSAVLIVSADALSAGGRQALEEAGCAVWSAHIRAQEMTWDALENQLRTDRLNLVELTCDEAGRELLEEALPQMTGEAYRLRQALAPVLRDANG